MFGLFKADLAKTLQKAYAHKLEQAMQAACSGDMHANASLTEEAEALRAQIDKLKQE